MLKNITLGQYFPGESVIHKLDPRFKIVFTMVFIVMLFLVNEIWGYLLMTVLLGAIIIPSGIPLKVIVKSLKPMLFIIILTGILNLFYTTGTPLVEFWIFKITDTGVKMAVRMIVRIVYIIVGTSMLTYTTSPILLTDAIESLFSPLKAIKFPVHEMALMMTIALRFIPTLIEETEKIINAQKARGADFESGNLVRRAKALVPILIPLFVSAFRRADELATAMECRCYTGGAGRTHLRRFQISGRDIAASVLIAVFFGGVIALKIF